MQFVSLEANIPKLFLLKISSWLLLIMPTIIPFFTDMGLNMTQIMLLQTSFSVVVVILEVPSGYFSDVVGRKKTLCICLFFAVLGFGVFAFASTFYWFLIAEMLLGVSASLSSGTDSALLYDSLVALERKEEYLKLQGRISASGNFAEGVAAIIGGFLGALSLRYPYYGQIFISLVGLLLAFSLIEPPQGKPIGQKEKASWSNIFSVVTKIFTEYKLLRSFILLAAIIGLGTLIGTWFSQSYFDFVGLPLIWFGTIWALLQFTVGITSWYVEPISKIFGQRQLMLGLVLTLVGCFFAMSYFSFIGAIAFVFIIYMVRGISGAYFVNIINELALPEYRATTLSIQGLVFRGLFGIFAPLLGWAADVYTVQVAFLASALFVLIVGLLIIFQITLLKAT